MPFIQKIRAWWLAVPEEKRAKITYEIGSVINTFIAAFLIQVAVDIEAARFVISLDMVALFSLITAAARAGIKAVLQLIVAWIRARYSKP